MLYSDDSAEAQAYKKFRAERDDHDWDSDLLGKAAAWLASNAYEKHVQENGPLESPEQCKEILAGFASAFVDGEVEANGFEGIDKEKAKEIANASTSEAYDRESE